MYSVKFFLIAALTCLSLSSCAFLRGGDEAPPVEPTGRTGGADENRTTLVDQVDETSAEETVPEDTAEPLQVTTLYSTASLNVRSGRGTSFPVVAGLSYGDAVEAARLEDGWYELFEEGQSVGFAHSNYLSTDKPVVETSDGVPTASFDTGLFGVSLPVGSSLVDRSPLKEDADARETYRVPMATDEIRAFYVRELASLGWDPYPAESETILNYRKGDLVIAVVLDGNGQRFTLTGGQR